MLKHIYITVKSYNLQKPIKFIKQLELSHKIWFSIYLFIILQVIIVYFINFYLTISVHLHPFMQQLMQVHEMVR